MWLLPFFPSPNRDNGFSTASIHGSATSATSSSSVTPRSDTAFGWGDWTILRTGDDAVLGLRHDWCGSALVTVHNFATEPRNVRLSVKDVAAEKDDAWVDMLCQGEPVEPKARQYVFELEPYGSRWLRAGSADSVSNRTGPSDC